MGRERDKEGRRRDPEVDQEALGEQNAPDVRGPERVDDGGQVERERRRSQAIGHQDHA